MPELTKLVNTELQQGFTVSQVTEKHGLPESLVWSIALEGKDDLQRFKELNWELRTVDPWEWTDCDKRFGGDWPGRLPAQMIAHILYFFPERTIWFLTPWPVGTPILFRHRFFLNVSRGMPHRPC